MLQANLHPLSPLAEQAIHHLANRSLFVPSQLSQVTKTYLQDGLLPSSQDLPSPQDPLAFTHQSAALQLPADVLARGVCFGTSPVTDVRLPETASCWGVGREHAVLGIDGGGHVMLRDLGTGLGSRIAPFGESGAGGQVKGGEVGMIVSGDTGLVLELGSVRFLVVVKGATGSVEAGGRAERRQEGKPRYPPARTESQMMDEMFGKMDIGASFMICD